MRQDKGQAAFLKSIEKGKEAHTAFEELMEVSQVSIEMAQQLREQQ